jgi:UDP-N-acetylmuramate dehydrogenase
MLCNSNGGDYSNIEEPLMIIQENHSLKTLHTFGIDVSAKYFATFEQVHELAELYDFVKKNRMARSMILGGGSNVLFTKDFDGLLLKNQIKGISFVKEDPHFVYLKVGAGESWHGFVEYCISKNLGGVENLSLIPGCVGASPMQNIGAYGVEIKDVFEELEAWHLNDQQLVRFNLQDCAFGYRDSVFKQHFNNQFAIVSVTYKLRKQPVFNVSYGTIQQALEEMGVQQLSVANISAAVIKIRTSKLPDPAKIGNAGSFFKNPTVSAVTYHQLQLQFPDIIGYPLANNYVKLAAGWLIEQCDFKGYRKGDAGCYPKQALVLVNYGNALGSHIFELSQHIIEAVQLKFGVSLEREVNIL